MRAGACACACACVCLWICAYMCLAVRVCVCFYLRVCVLFTATPISSLKRICDYFRVIMTEVDISFLKTHYWATQEVVVIRLTPRIHGFATAFEHTCILVGDDENYEPDNAEQK